MVPRIHTDSKKLADFGARFEAIGEFRSVYYQPWRWMPKRWISFQTSFQSKPIYLLTAKTYCSILLLYNTALCVYLMYIWVNLNLFTLIFGLIYEPCHHITAVYGKTMIRQNYKRIHSNKSWVNFVWVGGITWKNGQFVRMMIALFSSAMLVIYNMIFTIYPIPRQ